MKAYNRNFILMLIGQIISLFGNTMLRFSLSLYVLKVTGSPSQFATILALSIVPTILLSPFGGILADRKSRKHIMLGLDFLSALLILLFALGSRNTVSIVLIAVLMISLSLIQALYQPSVQASIPLLVEEEQLMQANGLVVSINALASLAGPILGGFLFSIVPFWLLLNMSALAFFLSAILECIMDIPYTKPVSVPALFPMIRKDLQDSFQFLRCENPSLWKLLFLLAGLNLFLSSFITVGLPVISNITLQLPPSFYGWLEAGIGIGSIAGSLSLPLFLHRVQLQQSYWFLFLASLFLLPMAVVLCLTPHVYLCYACILLSSIAIMLFAALFNIYAQTYLQKATPNHLLGKVASFATMVVMCSYPIGQSLYGWLLEHFQEQMPLLILFACITSLCLSYVSKHTLKINEKNC